MPWYRELAVITLRSVDPAIPELFKHLLETSEYGSETLYRVFMSHGSGAKEIIEYAIEKELMPFELIMYSDRKLSESAEEALTKLKEFGRIPTTKEKLPKKFRNGWK